MTKAELVAEHQGMIIRSVTTSLPHPSVIRLSRFIRVPYKKVELSRRNIIRRDGFCCQYCGSHTHELTIDHIIPKSKGGIDSWDNLVSACKKCNNKKGDKTPEEAGLKLQIAPRRPNHIVFIRQFMSKSDQLWAPFLFM